jgi:hypothetical protein
VPKEECKKGKGRFLVRAPTFAIVVKREVMLLYGDFFSVGDVRHGRDLKYPLGSEIGYHESVHRRLRHRRRVSGSRLTVSLQ